MIGQKSWPEGRWGKGGKPLSATERMATEAGISLGPGSTFEAVLEERVRGIEKTLAEISGRVNQLFYAIVLAIAVDALLRLFRPT